MSPRRPARARRVVALVALTVAGCGGEREEAAREAAEDPDALRPRRGAQVDCAGPPDDPDEVDTLAEVAASGDLAGAILGLEALTGAHPRSSSARVRLGELLLRTEPPRAEEADGWFERALALHARGCRLGHRDEWAAHEGRALSRMMRGDYAGAIAPLRASLARWPSVPATRYNLACALCQTGDLDGCARELEATLRRSPGPPSFLAGEARPPAHYRALARRDPDLAPLRADAARFAALVGGEPP
ncbi:MAG: hypothetical protein KF729_00695 [Sandaracinaceae bacterium]|nr:hypothetical protein [Sandaracinaceae bacterium]